LIHSIETVVIDWTHQIHQVLKKDSSQPLIEGLNPGPMVEIEFWKAKCLNLENIVDQVKSLVFFLKPALINNNLNLKNSLKILK
jgi:dynein heavy chain, axonemal